WHRGGREALRADTGRRDGSHARGAIGGEGGDGLSVRVLTGGDHRAPAPGGPALEGDRSAAAGRDEDGDGAEALARRGPSREVESRRLADRSHGDTTADLATLAA